MEEFIEFIVETFGTAGTIFTILLILYLIKWVLIISICTNTSKMFKEQEETNKLLLAILNEQRRTQPEPIYYNTGGQAQQMESVQQNTERK